ncbi:MAG: endonuclease domain-containing protein [Patescibacteria group bacterium]
MRCAGHKNPLSLWERVRVRGTIVSFSMLSHLLQTTKKTLERARALRKDQGTLAERHLWFQLRNRKCAGLKFRRQVPLGPFITDFLCAEARLIIELDGSSHEEKETYDAERTRFLDERGFRVLRFRNQNVFENMEGVLEEIVKHVPSPLGRR